MKCKVFTYGLLALNNKFGFIYNSAIITLHNFKNNELSHL